MKKLTDEQILAVASITERVLKEHFSIGALRSLKFKEALRNELRVAHRLYKLEKKENENGRSGSNKRMDV